MISNIHYFKCDEVHTFNNQMYHIIDNYIWCNIGISYFHRYLLFQNWIESVDSIGIEVGSSCIVFQWGMFIRINIFVNRDMTVYIVANFKDLI